ncbi:hypothetical protein, partial [Candidatus Venteria ishoeyi]|uniref:hypothetical protein n=1 Tax=Candidatus Venteria ishoeyi TaxID=1899563 RepID=UPI00255CD2BF
GIWQDGTDCLFLDSDEATKEQISFITRVKRHFDWKTTELETLASAEDSPFKFRIQEDITSPYEAEFIVPNKFKHVDLEKLHKTENQVNALKSVLKKYTPGHRCITAYPPSTSWSNSTWNGYPNITGRTPRYKFSPP